MIDYETATLKEAALDYAAHNVAVFPVNRVDKSPKISGGCTSATTDPAQIEEWWNRWPDANIATPTGQPFGIYMIDADRDTNKFGPEQFEGWQNNNGSFGDSWTVTTGRGGKHLYLRSALDLHNVQAPAQPEHLRDIDFRGFHGYAVLPPSVHENGSVYRWDDERGPYDITLAQNDELLKKFHDDLTQKTQRAQNAQTTQNTQSVQGAQNTLNIPTGSRNGTITSLLGKLQHDGFPDELVKRWAHDINEFCDEPLTDREVDTIANSVTRYEKGTIRTVETPAPKFTPYEVADYIAGEQMSSDINYFKKYMCRGTGFLNIDQYLTLYPGLAALGGAASLGKSTFCINLADNLIKQGETVLYFSLEQEPIELVTKSLSRRLAEKADALGEDANLTNLGIKDGATSDLLEQVKREYAADVAGKFFIIRGTFKTTAADIRDYIVQFIRDTGTKPIIFIDYLQLIAPPDDFKGDQRAAIDNNIKLFKTMQTANELLVIMVSNFNRSGYDSPVSYSDFKETSMIEYTCDYIWGLQLEILSHHEFYMTAGVRGERQTTAQEKDEMIDRAIADYPKQVQFVSLKSRNGKQRYKCNFSYYMPYDYFQSDLINPFG